MWLSQDEIALFEVFGQYHNQMVLINYYGCPNNQPKLEHNVKKNLQSIIITQ